MDDNDDFAIEASPPLLSPIFVDLTQVEEKYDSFNNEKNDNILAIKPTIRKRKHDAVDVSLPLTNPSSTPPPPAKKARTTKKPSKAGGKKNNPGGGGVGVNRERLCCLLSFDIGIRNLAYIAANAQRTDKRVSVFWWDNVDVLRSNGCNATKALAVPVETLLSCVNLTLVERFGKSQDGTRCPLAELVDRCSEVHQRLLTNEEKELETPACLLQQQQRPYLRIKIEKQRKESTKNMMIMAVLYTFLDRELRQQGFGDGDYSITLVSSCLKFNFITRVIPDLVQEEIEDGRRPPAAAEAKKLGLLISAARAKKKIRGEDEAAAVTSKTRKLLTKKEIDSKRYASNKRLAKKAFKRCLGGGDGAPDCVFVAEGPFRSVNELKKRFSGKLDDVSECMCQMLEDTDITTVQPLIFEQKNE